MEFAQGVRKGDETVFCNKYNHTVDDKGRMIIPTEYRGELAGDALAHPFYITTNLWDPAGQNEPCLCLWPEESFLALRDKLRAVSGQDENNRRLKRQFFSNTQQTTLDKQGRISVIPELKEYAKIDRNVMLVGADEHIEVWDYDAWARYNEKAPANENLWSETLGSLGF